MNTFRIHSDKNLSFKRRVSYLKKTSRPASLQIHHNSDESNNRIETAEKFLVKLDNPVSSRIVNKILVKSNFNESQFIESIKKWLVEFDLQSNLEIGQKYSISEINVAFAFSAILDLVSWGGRIEITDSFIWLHKIKSEINDSSNSDRMRKAMTVLKKNDVQFFTKLSDAEAIELLISGSIEFEKVESKNFNNSDLFRKGLTTWSMPYRGREGRSTRFILWIKNSKSKEPLGIIEVGDDAPFSPLRDAALGFSGINFLALDKPRLANRLFLLRKTMLKNDLPIDPTLPFSEFIKIWNNKNLSDKAIRDKFSDKSVVKRLNYLARIISGESSLLGAAEWSDKDVSSSIRAIKDVSLNRVHTEVVICGALPPFGKFLGGKIIAMMMNHPLVRETLDRDIGILLAESFDRTELEKWLPRYGPLLTTTKGLYPNHSALYNRVRFPSSNNSLKLQKLGSTEGLTMSHISDRTMSYAVKINEDLGEDGVSREYGSGGSKRQRIIQKAALTVGIAPECLYADVTRPVYGVSYASNNQDIVLYGEEPNWKDPLMLSTDSKEYEVEVLRIWRNKWLPRAQQNVSREE
jgi:hypothetical protein